MLRARNVLGAVVAALVLGPASTVGAVEPWSDADPPSERRRSALGDFGFRGGAEDRAQLVDVNPISLNTENAREVSWMEHRLALSADDVLLGTAAFGAGQGDLTARSIPTAEAPSGIPQPP